MTLDVLKIAGQASVPSCAAASPLLRKCSAFANLSPLKSTCLDQHPWWTNQRSARCELTLCRAKSVDTQRPSDESAGHINRYIKDQDIKRRQYRQKEEDDCTVKDAVRDGIVDRDGSDKGECFAQGALESKDIRTNSAKEGLHGEQVAQPRELTDGGQKTAPRPKPGRKPQLRYHPKRRLPFTPALRRFSSPATSATASIGAILTSSSPTCHSPSTATAAAPAAASPTLPQPSEPWAPSPANPKTSNPSPPSISSPPSASTSRAAAPATASPPPPPPGLQPGRQPLLGPVHVLWDLDNKYPLVLDHAGLVEDLRASLRRFGEVVEIRAYCNYQTLNHVPHLWDQAMAIGMEHPLAEDQPDELRCPLCGQRFKEPLKLEKHFKQLHEREHQKRLAHQPVARKYVKGAKFERYQAAKREVLPKQRGFNLEGILKRSGVVVVPVQMGPQKADVALERDARQLLEQAPPPDSGQPRPVVALVSDDRGFKPLVKMFRSRGWFTVVVSGGAFMDADARVDWGRLVGEHLRRA